METSESAERPAHAQTGPRRQSPSSSPDAEQDSGFVLVPNSLAGDSSRNKNMHAGLSPVTSRRVGSRPGSLPVISKGHSTEPIPVPTQKAAYAAIQSSLIHSRAAEERNSVSAMSGVSSASGGSILGPLPEEELGPAPVSSRGCPPAPSPALLRRPRCASLSSPASSPRSPSKQFPPTSKARKISAPAPGTSPAPDIISLSPPNVQSSMGTPPVAHRRRTSSCSSSGSTCGTSPPGPSPGGWTLSPAQISPRSSPLRHSRSGRFTPPASSLPPILGSPARPLSDQVMDNMAAGARNNNNPGSGDMRRPSTTELQVMATATASRNTVVLNYPGPAPPSSRSWLR